MACGPPEPIKTTLVVTPAKAGVHFRSGKQWIPAFAGMTWFAEDLVSAQVSAQTPVQRSSPTDPMNGKEWAVRKRC
ncbi:hypothetical protein SBA2_470032 [Acidobacteriia bacterium SbA2]|nr:hypothetical protein SBA2_470032 [Acidobacteriia bacterium SbA2]